ncbi:hypothetical protein BaRGS_00016215 [Batillaria attramentaria]|uniref:GH18 domain-containing protein n=1 Tax=Batillaria attramentaria TaxID=370345 RepID=A0ABD0L0G4_9CAEN
MSNTTFTVPLCKLLQVYTDVKVLAAIGHWEKDGELAKMMRSSRKRRPFVRALTRFLRTHNLDGLTIHWTPPEQPKRHLARDISSLVREVAKAFLVEAKRSKKTRLILGLDIPADENQINAGFLASSISMLDVAFLKVHQMNVKWTWEKGSLLYRRPIGLWNADKAVRKWAELRLEASKIMLDLELAMNRRYITEAQSTTEDFPKPYYNTCQLELGRSEGRDMVFGPGYTFAALGDNGQFVDAQENSDSLIQKVSFAISYGMGGIHFVDLNYDDYKGRCLKSKKPPYDQFVKFPLAIAAVEACAVTQQGNASEFPATSTGLPQAIRRDFTGCRIMYCMYRNRFKKVTPKNTLHPEDIDATYCTHLMFGFFHLRNDTPSSEIGIHPSSEKDFETIEKLVRLKEDYPYLAIMLGLLDIEQANEGPLLIHIETVSNSYTKQERIALEAAVLLRQLNLDGLDLDWLFPTQKVNGSGFPHFLQTIRSVFAEEAERSGRIRLQLATAVYGHAIEYFTGLQQISAAVDIFRLDTTRMNYMVRGTPKNLSQEQDYMLRQPDIEAALKHIKKAKVRSTNVVLSLSFEARAYTYIPNRDFLQLNGYHQLPQTKTNGWAAYYEICPLKDEPGVTDNIDMEKGGQFLTYEEKGKNIYIRYQDETLIRTKTNMIMDKGFAGCFIPNLAADDYTGEGCNHGAFPLLTAAGSGCAQFERDHQATESPIAILGKELAATPTAGCVYVVCYYNNDARQRPGKGKMLPKDIDPTLCTHLIFSHAVLDGARVTASLPEDVGPEGTYNEFIKLKRRNNAAKMLLSIRGTRSSTYSKLASGPKGFTDFVSNAVKFTKEKGFDGIEIDWEVKRPEEVKKSDRDAFSSLMVMLNTTLKTQGLLLAVKLSGDLGVIERLYDGTVVGNVADLLMMNTYSWYHWQRNVFHYSPIFRRQTGVAAQATVNITVDAVTTMLISKRFPQEKLVVGIGLFGKTFTLTKRDFNEPGDESSSPGFSYNFTQQLGTVAAFEWCEVKKKGAKVKFIDEQLVPYMVYDNQWIGIENELSIKQKVRYSKLYRLGGVSIFSVDADDFRGSFCGSEPFPLLRAVKRECSVIGGASVALSKAAIRKQEESRRDDIKRVCYLSTENLERSRPTQFDATYIPFGICNHYIIDSLTFENDGAMSGLTPTTLNAIRTLKLLLLEDAYIKISFSIKASSETSFREVASSADKRRRLFETLMTIFRSQNLYGVDIQWTDVEASDASTYVDFIRLLHKTLRDNEKTFTYRSGDKFQLSLAVGKKPVKGVNYTLIEPVVDFVNVFSFDYAPGWDNLSHNNLMEDFKASVSDFLKAGVIKKKLIPGLPLYAKVFKGVLSKITSLHGRHFKSCVRVKGPLGVSTKTPGRWTYYELCYQIQADKHKGFKISGYTDDGKPMAGASSVYYNKKLWASYDSRNKIQDKVQWIVKEGLPGYTLYTIDGDVFLQAMCDFSVQEFPISHGALLASRGFKQFQYYKAAASAPPASRLALGSGWFGGRVGIRGTTPQALVISAMLGTVYYATITVLIRN